MSKIDWTDWILKKNIEHRTELLKSEARDMSGNKLDASMILSELESIIRNATEIKKHIKLNDIAPDWVKSQISKAANDLSGIADYIVSLNSKTNK